MGGLLGWLPLVSCSLDDLADFRCQHGNQGKGKDQYPGRGPEEMDFEQVSERWNIEYD